MFVNTEEVKGDSGRESHIDILLEDLGVVNLPDHVLTAAGSAAGAVVDNYRRTGTACGHQVWKDTARCAVMSCEQYVERWRTA